MTDAKKAVCIQHPEKAYKDPGDILNDDSLSETEKLKALRSWELDQKALLRADDESLACTGLENVSSPGEMVQNIQHAERKLDRKTQN